MTKSKYSKGINPRYWTFVTSVYVLLPLGLLPFIHPYTADDRLPLGSNLLCLDLAVITE